MVSHVTDSNRHGGEWKVPPFIAPPCLFCRHHNRWSAGFSEVWGNCRPDRNAVRTMPKGAGQDKKWDENCPKAAGFLGDIVHNRSGERMVSDENSKNFEQ